MIRSFSILLLFLLLVPAFSLANEDCDCDHWPWPTDCEEKCGRGSILGKILDENGKPLYRATVRLLENSKSLQETRSSVEGTFSFAKLQSGTYSVNVLMDGFAEIMQEGVKVVKGMKVEIEMRMKSAVGEIIVVTGDLTINPNRPGTATNIDPDVIASLPGVRDPWVIIDQNVAAANVSNIGGSESGQQAVFLNRGAESAQNSWAYDGINVSGISGNVVPTFGFAFAEELQISTGSHDVTAAGSGLTVNVITSQPTNSWEANAFSSFAAENLQANNVSDELIRIGVNQSNRVDSTWNAGFDLGGPILKDKLLIWGGFQYSDADLFTRVQYPASKTSLSDQTSTTDHQVKLIWNQTSEHGSQITYSYRDTNRNGAGFDSPIQSEETLWKQENAGSLLDGIITGLHSWVAGDQTFVTARFSYYGNKFKLLPLSAAGQPIIFLAQIPRYEGTSVFSDPVERSGFSINSEVTHYLPGFLGADHDLKFGFDYRRDGSHTFSSYGNGQLVVDLSQPTINGPLESGEVRIQHFGNARISVRRYSIYLGDDLRFGNWTINAGVRFDGQSGRNLASEIPGVPGFENIVGPVHFPGNDSGPRFTDMAPRLGFNLDVGGKGESVIRGSYSRYYDRYDSFYDAFSNPAGVSNGAILQYRNLNADRIITGDEVISEPLYYGGLSGSGFDLRTFAQKRIYGDLKNPKTNEFIFSLEQKAFSDWVIGVSYTHRNYSRLIGDLPFGVIASDFVQGGVLQYETDLGSFNVPYTVLGFVHDGTHILKNIEGYSRSYNGLDITAKKRMSHRFYLNSSLTLQKQRAHYDGDESFFVTIGQTLSEASFADPGLLAFYDKRSYGGIISGRLPQQSDWVFKASGHYEFPAEFTIGAAFKYQQGFPRLIFGTVQDLSMAAFYGTGVRRILLEPIGNRRYDNLFAWDLSVQKPFDLGRAGTLTPFMEILNITNSGTILQRENRASTETFNEIQRNLLPRIIRFGIRYQLQE